MSRLKIAAVALLLSTSVSHAGVLTYSDRASFVAALETFTTIDTSTYIGQTTFQIDDDPVFGGEFEFFGPNAMVRSDDFILNGQGFFGTTTPHVSMNFASGINGIGVTTNSQDGGDILIYSGLNGTGNLLGEADFGDALVLFGGITSTDLIRSVIFTCEFNGDLRCGLRDPVYGSVAAVPAPAAIWLSASVWFGLMVFARRRLFRKT